VINYNSTWHGRSYKTHGLMTELVLKENIQRKEKRKKDRDRDREIDR